MKKSLPAWVIILIACVSSITATWLVGTGFDALSKALYTTWGITGLNIVNAPMWLQTIVGNYDAIRETLQSLSLIALTAVLCAVFGRKRIRWGRSRIIGFTMGFGAGIATIGALIITDGMRMGRLTPTFDISMPFSLIAYISGATGLVYMFASFIPAEASFAKYGADIWATALICACLTSAEYTPATVINLTLISVICVYLVRIYSVGTACLFRAGLYVGMFIVMGASSSGKGIFECYPAAHDWLSGEYSGPVNGYMLTLFLLAELILIRFFIIGGHNGRLIADKCK